MAKEKFPKGWSQNSPPYFYGNKPKKIIPAYTELSNVRVYDGDELTLEPDRRYRIALDTDYSGCYYSSDTPSIEARLIGFSEEDIENPNYDSELRKYNREKKKHQEELEEWNKWKVVWDAEQEKAKEIAERKKLQELKAKYEK